MTKGIEAFKVVTEDRESVMQELLKYFPDTEKIANKIIISLRKRRIIKKYNIGSRISSPKHLPTGILCFERSDDALRWKGYFSQALKGSFVIKVLGYEKTEYSAVIPFSFNNWSILLEHPEKLNDILDTAPEGSIAFKRVRVLT